VEDVVELRLAGDQVVEAPLARLAEILDDAVDQLAVADLVLDLRRQRELPLQRRRAQDPVALGTRPASNRPFRRARRPGSNSETPAHGLP
jgi:hypothetical protein